MISTAEQVTSNELGEQFIDAVVFSMRHDLLQNSIGSYKTPLEEFIGKQLFIATLGSESAITRIHYDEFGACDDRRVTSVQGIYISQVSGGPQVAHIERRPQHFRRLLGNTTFWATIVDKETLEPQVAVRIDE